VSAALAPAFVVAALLLCLAGVLKLRSPAAAAGALRALGLPSAVWIVRTLAVGEIALGVVCSVHPSRVLGAVLAATYVAFAAVAAALVRRRAACGCFGDSENPATTSHWIASAVLGAVAAAASVAGPRGLSWVLGRPVPTAAVLVVGIAGAVYATVIVYTQLPGAWAAWGGE
jgi:hypothetical protein